MNNKALVKARSPILDLPVAALQDIGELLPIDDLNSLGTTCKAFSDVFHYEMWKRDRDSGEYRATFYAIYNHNDTNLLQRAMTFHGAGPNQFVARSSGDELAPGFTKVSFLGHAILPGRIEHVR